MEVDQIVEKLERLESVNTQLLGSLLRTLSKMEYNLNDINVNIKKLVEGKDHSDDLLESSFKELRNVKVRIHELVEKL